MQQAIPYSSGRSSWLPASRRGLAFVDRSAFEIRSPLSAGSNTTMTTITTSSSGAGSVTSGGDSGSAAAATSTDSIRSLVSENPVLVLSRRGCCMCHVVRRLLLGLGVNTAVCEVDDNREEKAFVEELMEGHPEGTPASQFPAVFIGGKYVGGLDRLMAAHISGELVPLLKEAGALWL